MAKGSGNTRMANSSTAAATRTMNSNAASTNFSKKTDTVAKQIAVALGAPKAIASVDAKGAKDMKDFTFEVDKKQYTVRYGEDYKGEKIMIGTSNDIMELHRQKDGTWSTGGKFGKQFQNVQEIIKWVKK